MATSGYTEPSSITALYKLCARVDDSDEYLQPGFAASPVQISEIKAMLLLCPNHPFAVRFQQSVQRGQDEAEAEANGELFYSETFRVGEEIKPGTYAIEGDI